MIGRWGLYGDLFRELRKLPNITIDVAADAAKVADRVVRERRDYCILSARKSGMGVRAIARVWGIDPGLVSRICAQVLSDAPESQHDPDASSR